MLSSYSRKRTNLGVLYGFIAGFFFSLAAWGIDAVILAQHNVALPFLKFVPALLICVPAATLAGCMTAKLDKGIYGLLFWGGLAVLLAFLVINLPVKFSPWYLRIFRSDISTLINFEDLVSTDSNWFYSLFAIGLTCMLGGFLENILIDQGLASGSGAGVYIPLVICALIMFFSGIFGDLLMTSDFRKPLVAMDTLLENAAIYYDRDVDEQVERELHLGAAGPLAELVLEPHTLTLVSVDRYQTLMKVLVTFEDKTALCQTINGQPTFCTMINLPQTASEQSFFGSQKLIRVDLCFDDIIKSNIFPKTLKT